MFRVPLLICSLCAAALGACSSVAPQEPVAPAVAPLTIADAIQPKLAPQPGIDPTASQPLIQRRCDFSVNFPIDASWFGTSNDLTPDGRIALARNVLGPTAGCQRVELVNITLGPGAQRSSLQAKRQAEHRVDQVRQFFASRGIAPERIETRTPAADECDQSATCAGARLAIDVRGVAR